MVLFQLKTWKRFFFSECEWFGGFCIYPHSHRSDEAVGGARGLLKGTRTQGRGARGVQMCRRFCKVTVDTRRGTRKCPWIMAAWTVGEIVRLTALAHRWANPSTFSFGGGEDAEEPEGRTDARRWSCQRSESKCLPWNPSSKKEFGR